MAKFDIRTIGLTGGNLRQRVAASATRVYVGEPVMTTPTYTTGATNANTVVALTTNKPTVGTDEFRGICAKDFLDANGKTTGTVVAQYTSVTQYIPHVTRARGKGTTYASIDTQAELTGILGDTARFVLTGTAYTIESGGGANAGGLQIVDGSITRGTLDATVDARAFRTVIS